MSKRILVVEDQPDNSQHRGELPRACCPPCTISANTWWRAG
jgi:hypothetical protein